MKQITLKDLKKSVDKLIKEGHGDKLLVCSDDNEGNGYHGMFYGITVIEESDIKKGLFPECLINDSNHTDLRNVLIVG